MVADRPARSRRVLVTRPVGKGNDALCLALKEAGYDAFSQPLLEIHPIEELSASQRKLLHDLDLYQHIIFISSNAVGLGMDRVQDVWPQLPVGLNWYAIGDSTAGGLASFGVDVITPGRAMNSEGLLAIPALQDVRDQRVLIVKGEGGRDTLRQELSRRGARVDELACYRRGLPTVEPGELVARLSRWDIGVILISSGEGLANLQLLLTPAETSKLKPMALIVPSGRVAGQARDAGFDQVVTAENASDSEMLRALEHWSTGTGD